MADKGIEGEIIGLDDPYGSLITDVPGEEFKQLGYDFGDPVTVQINRKPLTVPFSKTFMDVPVGKPLLYIDSRGRVGIALNQGNFARKFNVAPPASLFIARKGQPTKAK